MNSDNLTACPVCNVTWLGGEVPDELMAKNPDFYNTRKKAEEAAAAYGWTKRNKKKFSTNMIGIEYPWHHPQHYDGVSEWKCTECNARIGRWSGKVLREGQVEGRFGKLDRPVAPVGSIPDNDGFKYR